MPHFRFIYTTLSGLFLTFFLVLNAQSQTFPTISPAQLFGDTTSAESFRGMYTQLGGYPTLSDCRTGKIVRILPKGAYQELKDIYKKARREKLSRVYVEIDGYYADKTKDQVVAQEIVLFQNIQVCPSQTKTFLVRLKTQFIEYSETLVEWGIKFGTALAILLLGFGLINWFDRPLKSFIDNRRRVDPSVKSFIKSLISIGLRLSVIMFSGAFLGLKVTGFVALFSAATLAIGFALQGSLSNFAGGFIILLMKQFKVGEKITSQNYTGVVRDILMFNTVLDTGDGRRVMIPNGPLLNNTIINHTRAGFEKRGLKIYTASDVDTEHLKSMIVEQMADIETLVQLALTPDVKITDWNGERLEITISYQTPTLQSEEIFEKVVQRLNNRLHQENLTFYTSM
ncbi:mechanosensitive ion channel [Runella sp. CRIBMP]|uniref:mechanosensitive ion channel domain-containing protein n=1 Tax=Runella sp. CRIBMP TaxID=2683261 RepID=UPI0014120E66|nr:mechanosensitive ion channel domain-containing protein [Runella sp. CRIBMP]NBB21054.1 mechanosensitive ion channel [Runella sp. CRIBMP]